MNDWNKKFKIECVNGKDSLKNFAPIIQDNTLENGKNIIIFDADDDFEKSKNDILSKKEKYRIDFELFLFPNHRDNGQFEDLLVQLIRPQHQQMLTCFKNYEICLNANKYYSPDIKAKVYAFISAMNLSNKERQNLGSGNWQFANNDYWDLDNEYLKPLIETIKIFDK